MREAEYSRTAFKIPAIDELVKLNRTLDKFSKPIILDRETYEAVEPLMLRVVEIISNSSIILAQLRMNPEKGNPFDLTSWTTRFNHYEQSKVLAYQKRALDLISKTHKSFDDARFFLKTGKTHIFNKVENYFKIQSGQ